MLRCQYMAVHDQQITHFHPLESRVRSVSPVPLASRSLGECPRQDKTSLRRRCTASCGHACRSGLARQPYSSTVLCECGFTRSALSFGCLLVLFPLLLWDQTILLLLPSLSSRLSSGNLFTYKEHKAPWFPKTKVRFSARLWLCRRWWCLAMSSRDSVMPSLEKDIRDE